MRIGEVEYMAYKKIITGVIESLKERLETDIEILEAASEVLSEAYNSDNIFVKSPDVVSDPEAESPHVLVEGGVAIEPDIKEEAAKKILQRITDFSCRFTPGQKNYFLLYSHDDNKLIIDYNKHLQSNNLYFDSKEKIVEMIADVGLENVLVVMFGLNKDEAVPALIKHAMDRVSGDVHSTLIGG